MTDAMCYPAASVAELYKHRWETELGYREVITFINRIAVVISGSDPGSSETLLQQCSDAETALETGAGVCERSEEEKVKISLKKQCRSY
jgi:hypothetical protein